MCHSRWREQRDERFEQELRDLYDRQRERPEKATPIVEDKPAPDQVPEPDREEVSAVRS